MFTEIWIGSTFAILVISIILVCVWKHNGSLGSHRRLAELMPSAMSSFGVLGTFIGITQGLMNFDTNDIDGSIPALLEGMKTAFYTSLAGMGGALVQQTINSWIYDKTEKSSDIAIAAGMIIDAVGRMENTLSNVTTQQDANQTEFYKKAGILLSDLQGNTANMHGDLSKTIETIQTVANKLASTDKRIEQLSECALGISSSTERMSAGMQVLGERIQTGTTSITEQMQSNNELIGKKFDDFSELLKRSNTDALVDVMKAVTEEFQKQMNQLIARLIQENFQKLNESVDKLNTWQVENKEMIQRLTSQYHQMATDFEDTSTTLTKVGQDTQLLVSEGGKLEQIINALQAVMVDDDRFVSISENLTKAAEDFREANGTLKDNTQKLSEWGAIQQEFANHVTDLVSKISEINKINNYSEQFWQSTLKGMSDAVDIITNGSQALQQQVDSIDMAFYNRLSTTLGELDTLISSFANNRRF